MLRIHNNNISDKVKVFVVQSGIDKQTVTLCYEIMSLIKLKKTPKNKTNKTTLWESTSFVQSVTVIVVVIKVCILIEDKNLMKTDSIHIYDVHLSLLF